MERNENKAASNTVKKQHRKKERLKRNNSYSNVESQFHSNLNWLGQPVLPPHRILPTHETPYSSYPVHLGYPIDAYQLSLYPSMYSPHSSSTIYPTIPPRRRGPRRDVSKSGPQLNNLQEFTSLPPTNHDDNSKKSSDSDSQRHFSDPGVAIESTSDSDECNDGDLSTVYYTTMQEEMRILKESNMELSSQIKMLQTELRDIKTANCQTCFSGIQPGSLSDAISDLRKASQTREDALVTRLNSELHISTAGIFKILDELSSRLSSLELKIEKNECHKDDESHKETEQADKSESASIDSGNRDAALKQLKDEKMRLENELKDAQSGRSEAEANTKRLERLVAILRTKINGLIPDWHLSEGPAERHGATIDKNPFIIMDSAGKPFKSMPDEETQQVSQTSTTSLVSLPKQVPNLPVKPPPVVNRNGSLKTNPSLPAKPNVSQSPKPVICPSVPPRPTNCSPKSGSEKEDGTKQRSPQANFAVGKAVTPSFVTSDFRKRVEFDSNQETSAPATSSLGGTITIVGPVTDL